MLYEPTNIIPSTMTQTGTVAATTDNVNIQWQVNGNSAMTMFQIDVMQNNADSTFVYSTGIVTENPTAAQGYSLPFYGKDRFGDYVQFVYQPNETWAAWSDNAISDGNSYKFRITQFFQESGAAYKVPITSDLSAGSTYYFFYPFNNEFIYVSFFVKNAADFVSGNTVYYNALHNVGWIATSGNNNRIISDISFAVSTVSPSGTPLNGTVVVASGDTFYNQFFTTQNSASSFITRTEPTLTITPLAETPVASATQNFTATYSQAQGDSINTVRWQLFNADDMSSPIDDTGEIATLVLSYEYNGLFDGQSYSVVCTVTTESGVSVSATLDFSVQYEQGTYTGDFTAQSLCHEDANLLKWESTEYIPGIDNPSGTATVSNGQLLLPENSTVSWSQKSDESGELQPLNFPQPWTAVWNGNIDSIYAQFLQEIKGAGSALTYSVSASALSPNGKLLVLAGSKPPYSGYISVFQVDGAAVSYLEDLTPVKAPVRSVAFSPSGDSLVVCGGGAPLGGFASIYSVDGTTINYIGDITKDGGAFTDLVLSVDFNYLGNVLVLGGSFNGRASLFSVNGTSVSYIADITKNGAALSSSVLVAKFNPSGNTLILGGYFDGHASVFSVNYFGINNITVNFEADIIIGGSPLNGRVDTVFYNRDGTALILGGDFSGYGAIFSVSGVNIEYVSTIKGEGGAALEGDIAAVAFSPDNSLVVIGGNLGGYSGWASVYSLSGGTVLSFYDKITLEDGKDINGLVSSALFSSDGETLFLAGSFDGYAAIFSVVGSTTTFLSYCQYQEQLDNIATATFSPDGSLLVLGGAFDGHASLFSVNGTTVTYLSDITKSGSSLNGSVDTAAFSPDGSLLVLGGQFDGGAALFSVNGVQITYQSNIELDQYGFDRPYTCAFSPNGNLLAIGGGSSIYPTPFAYLYSVSGTTLTKQTGAFSTLPHAVVSIIQFNNEGTLIAVAGSLRAYLYDSSGSLLSQIALQQQNNIVFAAEFSPDDSLLILGNSIYSISNNAATYIKNITKNGTELTQNTIKAMSFNSTGSILVLGGTADNYASAYHVSGQNIVWICDLTNSGTLLNSAVNSVTFNSQQNMFVIGGNFTGYAEAWSLYGTSENIEQIFEIQSNNIYAAKQGQIITLTQPNNTILGQSFVSGSTTASANQIVIALTPTALQVYSFLNNTYLGMQQANINYTQQNITSAQLQGQQTCNYFAIIAGDGDNIAQYLTSSTFVPKWDNSQGYTVELLADFNSALDGGTATATGTGFRIYRRTADGTENIELATLPSTTLSLRDYGIKSNESYIYDFYVYDVNGAFMGVRSTEATPLKRQFKRFSLLSTQYNESDNCYHVVKEYQFSCNIQDMSVSNNSNKSYVQNFTPYPTVFQSTANYASGTLQALIGFVDPKAYKYWDSTQLMDELNALSTTTNTLFLKDMKGHLWMVDVGTVQMTATQKTREMQVTISLPWTEIGDASDVSIIQTPDDEGWNTDAQVLDVKLDVDVETGLLQVVYPFPYNGAAFYLVGVTPEGVVSAVQPLPSTASQPTDGQLKAVVRHK